MRSKDVQSTAMWSYLSPEARVPADHPLRSLRELVNVALRKLSPEFSKMYSPNGRPSIPPERLLRALLLQMLYTVRSERMLMEQLNYNMLFRWFVGLNLDEPVWDVTVFTKNRERFLEGDIAKKFFAAVLDQARAANLLSDEHFTVDGTFVEPGRATRASSPRMTSSHRRAALGARIRRSTSKATSAPTTLMLPRAIPTLASTRRVPAAHRDSATLGTR